MKSGRIEYIGYKYYNKRQKTLDSLMGLIKGFLFYKIKYYELCGGLWANPRAYRRKRSLSDLDRSL